MKGDLLYWICWRFYVYCEEKSMEEMINDSWISLEDAANYLGVKKETVRSWIKKTDIPAHKIGKLWKFKKSELDTWVKSGKSAIE